MSPGRHARHLGNCSLLNFELQVGLTAVAFDTVVTALQPASSLLQFDPSFANDAAGPPPAVLPNQIDRSQQHQSFDRCSIADT